MSQVVCYCKNVTKAEIEEAVQNGAKSLSDIQKITGACTGNQCKDLNPSGKCCSADIKTILNKSDLKDNHSCCCCK
ncbi:MAG: (2Fe-2S)-binding protein [Bacteroidota bacterium]|nr:(2Fe-2S)-binding protein [Bacteroidota bacterium]